MIIENIEQEVADAILQRPSSYLTIKGVAYAIAPPTPATLILISELVSTLPEMDTSDGNNILHEVLHKAKDAGVIGKIVATLILGAKRILQCNTVKIKRKKAVKRFHWMKMRKVTAYVTYEEEVKEVDYLADLVMQNCSCHVLYNVVIKRLADMQIGDFFGLTTSLSGANLLKSTKEVGGTASGA